MFNFTKIANELGLVEKVLDNDKINKFIDFLLNKPEIKKFKNEYVNRFNEIDSLLLEEIKNVLPEKLYIKNEEVIKGLLFIHKLTNLLTNINFSSRFDNFIKFKLSMCYLDPNKPSWKNLDYDYAMSFYEQNHKDCEVLKILSDEILKECDLSRYQEEVYHAMRRIFNTLIKPIDSYLISQDNSETDNFFTNSLTEFLENSQT